MSFPKGMLGAAVLPRSQLQEEGVSIPPTVSTRSRSWKPARPEAGAWGVRRKKTGELVHNAPTQAVREAQTKHRHRHGGGQGGDKVGATVVSSWPEWQGHWECQRPVPLPQKWPTVATGRNLPDLDTWGEVKEKLRFSLLRPGASGRRRDLSPQDSGSFQSGKCHPCSPAISHLFGSARPHGAAFLVL